MPYVPLRRGAGRLFDENLNRMLKELFASMDVTQAENVVFSTYGDTVSVEQKAKNLNKFGRNIALTNTDAVIMTFQGSEVVETFGTTNRINSVISSNSGDTSLSIPYQGHTRDASGNMTFVTDTVVTDASDGQTRVALPTPVWIPTRARIGPSGTVDTPQSLPAGDISFYDNTDGDNGSGVPTTASATQLILPAGQTFSEKGATGVSQSDYWFISKFYVAVDEGTPTADVVFARMQVLDVVNGGNWVPLGDPLVLDVGVSDYEGTEFSPLEIVPKNHLWRIIGRTNAGTASVYSGARGVLAAVI